MQESSDSLTTEAGAVGRTDAVPVLTAVGDELQSQLGSMFRQKRPFALMSLDGMSAEELQHLQATAKKRRVCVYVLGGWRVCPPLAALKELVSGGCLGTVRSICWSGPRVWQAADICQWLSPETEAQSEESDQDEFEINVEGTAGRATAHVRLTDNSGELLTELNNHKRRREFAAADIARLEKSLLQTFGQERHIAPGLVPASGLQAAILKAVPRQDMSRGQPLTSLEGAQSSPKIIPPQKNDEKYDKEGHVSLKKSNQRLN